MLEYILLSQQLGPLGPTNFLKHAIHAIAAGGIAPEIPVLILLLPLAITLIAAARYLIGIQGLGIFTPVMMAVVFLSTGIFLGVTLFLVLLLTEILAINLLRRLKIHFMAKMALILWVVCLGLFLALLFSAQFSFQLFPTLSLVPVLILILLGEQLAEIQVRKSPKTAITAIGETIILAALAFFVLSSPTLRAATVVYPEILVLATLVFNLFLGQFTGLRLLEYRRFRKLLKK